MNDKNTYLRVNEIFYSIQGEGLNTGKPCVFIRLAGCNLQCDFCDTKHTSFISMSIDQIIRKIEGFTSGYICWTGGEPLLQLTQEIIDCFNSLGYSQWLETNGTLPIPVGFAHITISPKPESIQLIQNPRYHIPCDSFEIRIPVKEGQEIPYHIRIPGRNLFLSPIFTEDPEETQRNINYCVSYITNHPKWRLSVQLQKLCKFL